jgi:putative flippase GtrA
MKPASNEASMIRFAVIGLLCTAIQYLLLAALHGLAGWNAVIASSLGYAVSAVVSYLLNYRFSFDSTRSLGQGAWRYGLVVATGLAMNSLCLAALLSVGLALLPAQIITTGAVFLFNYQLSRAWAFNRKVSGPAVAEVVQEQL